MVQVYIFGGMDIQGRLLDDLWVFELDSMHWSQLQAYGARPSARKGEPTWHKGAGACHSASGSWMSLALSPNMGQVGGLWEKAGAHNIASGCSALDKQLTTYLAGC